EIRGGRIELTRVGRMMTTSQVILRNGGELRLENTHGNSADRVGDAIPITMTGGMLSLYGAADADSTETVGAVELPRGGTAVMLASNSTTAAPKLTLAALSRQAGATLNISGSVGGAGAGSGRLFISSTPALQNGILPPWITLNARTRPDFATYAP